MYRRWTGFGSDEEARSEIFSLSLVEDLPEGSVKRLFLAMQKLQVEAQKQMQEQMVMFQDQLVERVGNRMKDRAI